MTVVDLDHLERRAREVLKDAPDRARLGQHDVREWWCDMLVIVIAQLRAERQTTEKLTEKVRTLELEAKASGRAIADLNERLIEYEDAMSDPSGKKAAS